MQFTVYGLIEERAVQINWCDGFVTGDKAALGELFALSGVLEGKRVGPEPEGPYTTEDHLANPGSALILIEDVLDEVTGARGQLPRPFSSHSIPDAA